MSRFTIAINLKSKSNNEFNQQIAKLFAEIENDQLKTVTYDRGSEAYDFENIEQILRCNLYYCDPGNPGQRGLCENTNGLLRQFFPKGSNFAQIKKDQIDKVTDLLNNRPRKSNLGLPPFEVFHALKPVALGA
eukprot:UN34754